MNEKDKEVIKNLCDCNMNVTQTARMMYVHRNTVVYHIEKIKEVTGLDPTLFNDLVKLKEMIENGER